MSILIKGIKMPKSCGECKLRTAIGCCGNLPHNTRMLNCPLIELPLHGRLIDADALKAKRHWTDDFYETEYVEVEDIDDAPTIIEANDSGRQGQWGYRWKVHGDGRRPTELYPCSECGYENTSATNFCPNCGADMRESEGE